MKTWILILYFYAGPAADGDSVTVTSVQPAFTSQSECNNAGSQAVKMAYGSTKIGKFVCVLRTGPQL